MSLRPTTRRRLLLQGAAGIAAASALPRSRAQLKTADNPEGSPRWQQVKKSIFAGRDVVEVKDDLVVLEAPSRALDAAVVPVALRTRLPTSGAQRVTRLYLITDNNPSPMSGVFTLAPLSGKADLQTRLRVDEYTHMRAIAETADGKLYMATRFVKASGGCSAPPGKDAQAALATLGRMKLSVEGDPVAGRPLLAQLQISHPNHSGLAMDQYTRQFTPAHFVRQIDISYAGQPVLQAETDFSISENPNLRFWFVPAAAGTLKAQIIDTHERRFETTLELRPAAA